MNKPMNSLLLASFVPIIGAFVVMADNAGKALLKASVAQTEYLCNVGDEGACRKLALWTGGQCASPRMLGGCQADSYVVTRK